MRDYPSSDPGGPSLLFAHGAGAGEAHPWMTGVAAGLAARGVRVTTFEFPYKAAGRRLPDAGPVLEEAFAAVWRDLAHEDAACRLAGGKSMGGRIASQAVAAGALVPPPAGLVFFGYPLHPPGKPSMRRDRHLPSIDVPMLFIHGTRDPFGSAEELRALVASLPNATLELVEGGDHSLDPPTRRDRSGALIAQAMDRAARWILARQGHAGRAR